MNEVDTEVQRLKRRELLNLIASPEWETLKELLTDAKTFATSLLISATKKEVPDDFLKGQINILLFLLEGLPQQLNEKEREDIDTQQQSFDFSEGLGPPDSPRGDPYGESTSPER